jgi:hypothetical protein
VDSSAFGLVRLAELLTLDEEARSRVRIVVIEIQKPLNAFFDESRQDRHGHVVYAVTAYITTFEQGIALEREWDGVLKHWGIECFHARHCRNPSVVC